MRRCSFPVMALLISLITFSVSASARAQDWSLRENPELAAYFESEVSKLEQANELSQFQSAAEWNEAKPKLREQLFDMLGLNPLPAKTPLQPVVEGTTEEAEFVVERVHFQSMPGLYVTGNFYRPKNADKPLPTILYVCGHGQVKKDGVSYGNKTHYHYHGSWFARNGYNCLIIDTLQLGEIEGIHHGTYKMNRWWWNSRGYTPAGVEAWNCIRSLDYLETRPEVDATRIGVTGRSGGGAYSWWISALDERIRCAVPVAGTTSLRDHVVNGCVEGHCDCMFMVNTYRWDYAKVAALVAPRPLLISNTDKDTIFPLEGVVDIHRQVRHIYRLLDADKNLGLQITEGPHSDTQELHIHAFRWFNRFLKDDMSMIDKTAVRYFQPEQLKVLGQTPADEINTRVDELFVPAATPLSVGEVLKTQETLLNEFGTQLLDRSFRAWPQMDSSAISNTVHVEQISEGDKQDVHRLSFDSEPHVSLSVDISVPHGQSLKEITSLELVVELNSDPEKDSVDVDLPPVQAQAVTAPRGAGRGAWVGNEAKQIQIRRRFQLLGMTVDGMRVWDIRRAIQVVRQECPQLQELRLRARSSAESIVLLASLFEPPVEIVIAPMINGGVDQQPSILNLTRSMPIEMLPVLVASRSRLVTATIKADAQFAAEATSSKDWKGKSIVFGD